MKTRPRPREAPTTPLLTMTPSTSLTRSTARHSLFPFWNDDPPPSFTPLAAPASSLLPLPPASGSRAPARAASRSTMAWPEALCGGYSPRGTTPQSPTRRPSAPGDAAASQASGSQASGQHAGICTPAPPHQRRSEPCTHPSSSHGQLHWRLSEHGLRGESKAHQNHKADVAGEGNELEAVP